jgi:hypothetical protein
MNTERWSADKAWEWYRARAWLRGFNYVPSTAINPIEIWARETFDEPTIDRELGWAQAIGFNTLRINLHYFNWEADSAGLLERIDRFLTVAGRRGLSAMFCLFDDCSHSGKQPYHGKQDEPVPGVHNSGWTPSPGHVQAVDPACRPKLEAFVKGVVGRFAADARVLLWDLYNEPGASGMDVRSVPLLRECFAWARSVGPAQPISSGVYTGDFASPPPGSLTEAMLELSDIVTFHNYGDLPNLLAEIAVLRRHARPMLCTEWMRRPGNSLFQTHFPAFRQEEVGCYFWGLVNGKSQTQFPWGSPKGAPEPALWFHDLLARDGKPFSAEEVEVIKKTIGKS